MPETNHVSKEYNVTTILSLLFMVSISLVIIIIIIIIIIGARGFAVVEAPRYKPEGRGINCRWCHWSSSLT
jgi:hypothetical protein